MSYIIRCAAAAHNAARQAAVLSRPEPKMAKPKAYIPKEFQSDDNP